MDSELSYLLSAEPAQRVPAGKIALTQPQLVTNSVTNVNVQSLSASSGSSTVTATTVASHGLVPGEVVSVSGNYSQAAISTIVGDGTVATATTSQPHALLNGETVTVQNNYVNITNASVSSDGTTASVATSTDHGFTNGDTATLSYALGNITNGILQISGDGTSTVTVQTTTPHTFVTGDSVTVNVASSSGSISQITPNTPTAGVATVTTSSVPSGSGTVTITGGSGGSESLYVWPGAPLVYVPAITTSSGTATAILNTGTLPAGVSTGTAVTISGVVTSGQLTEITGNGGTSATVYTAYDHALLAGSTITISGITGANSIFNGTWTVASVLSSTAVNITVPFSSFAAFLTSASWRGTSGFNGTWTLTATGTVVEQSITRATVSFSTTCVSRASNTSIYSSPGTLTGGSSLYAGTYTPTIVNSTSFTIPSSVSAISTGGSWSSGSGFSGTFSPITVTDYLTFTYADVVTGSYSGGTVSGPSGLNTSGSVSVIDATSFSIPTTIDTGTLQVTGYNVTGLSGFNASGAISYIDDYNFTYQNSAVGALTGGNINSLSGFNQPEVIVLSVPSSTSFTYENVLAGTGLPYVDGSTSSTGTIATYNTSYKGLTTAQINWSQPAVFAANNMSASGAGFTVPIPGWYKIIGRVELSSTFASYTPPSSGAYAYIDIYVNGVLQARSNQVQQQSSALEYGLIVSDLVYVGMNQLITAEITAYTPTNSGQVYAYGSSANNLTYLSAIFVSE